MRASAGTSEARAAIVGIAGTILEPEERRLLVEHPPAGFILFKRNCASRSQLLDLTTELRALFPDRWVPILVDQEGGRVQRLGPPHWPQLWPARMLGRLAEHDRPAGEQATMLQAKALATMLREVGIDVVCAPCLDLLMPETTRAIGDRAFGADPGLVAGLGRITADTLLASGVLPVIKHLPGHGRATCDSHLELPRVVAERALLDASDWQAFRPLADLPLGMTAHIVFAAIDPDRPATQSPRVIAEVIRGAIGFQGLLLSDDLSMQALSGPIEERAGLALAAGCDLALHCNGDAAEVDAVLRVAPPLEPARMARLQALRPGPAAGEPLDDLVTVLAGLLEAEVGRA
ncbi:MAG: beta-N-acetylhexosaminidase [Geminicoccaceae bacterium]